MIIEKRWKLANQEFPKKKIKEIKQLGYSEEMSKILFRRNLINKKDIDSFINCSLDDLHDPFLLPDIKIFLDRIERAKARKEFVCVYGDYDTDGTVSASVLTRTLKKFGIKKIITLAPHRKYGYGLKNHIIKGLKRVDVSLIITCDCGSSNEKEIEYASKLKIDVMVTDHHDTIHKINALAFVNPKRSDSKYPFKDLCGAGIVFKIVQAFEYLDPSIKAIRCLDYIAIATVADVSNLVGENRIIVKNGMERLSKTKNVPLKVLMQKLGLYGRRVTSEMVGFIIAPRLNAPGRISTANITNKLLLSNNEYECGKLVKKLNKLNEKRKLIEQEIKNDAMEMLKDRLDDKVIVLASEKWHKGVIGIVSSVIKEYYTRPTFLFSIENGICYGSARNIEEFPLLESLEKCKPLLRGYGGHKMAAGLSISQENIEKFRIRMNKIANKVLDETSLIPYSKVDMFLNEKNTTMNFAREIKKLEPFGNGNEVPQFVIRDVKVSECKIRNRHLNLHVSKGKKTFNCPGFWMDEYRELINDEIQEFDILFEISENFYKGYNFLQLLLKDLKEVKLDW